MNALLFHKQMNICCPTQHFNVIPHSATHIGSHEPSTGIYFYNNLKNWGASQHASSGTSGTVVKISAWWRFMRTLKRCVGQRIFIYDMENTTGCIRIKLLYFSFIWNQITRTKLWNLNQLRQWHPLMKHIIHNKTTPAMHPKIHLWAVKVELAL